MNNIDFRLRAQGKSNPVIVLWIYDSRFKGTQFKYSTREVVSEDLWMKKKERVKIMPAKEKELNALNGNSQQLRPLKCFKGPTADQLHVFKSRTIGKR